MADEKINRLKGAHSSDDTTGSVETEIQVTIPLRQLREWARDLERGETPKVDFTEDLEVMMSQAYLERGQRLHSVLVEIRRLI